MTNKSVQEDNEFLQIIHATPLVSIDLILRNETGEVLLGRRLNRPAQGFWFVPGGRILKNERIQEALQRISRREIGVVVSEATLIGAFDHLYPDNFLGALDVSTHYVALRFAAALPGATQLTADNQHAELKWWTVQDLLAEPLAHENTKAYFRS